MFAFEMAQICGKAGGTSHKGNPAEQNTDFQRNRAPGLKQSRTLMHLCTCTRTCTQRLQGGGLLTLQIPVYLATTEKNKATQVILGRGAHTGKANQIGELKHQNRCSEPASNEGTADVWRPSQHTLKCQGTKLEQCAFRFQRRQIGWSRLPAVAEDKHVFIPRCLENENMVSTCEKNGAASHYAGSCLPIMSHHLPTSIVS